MPYIEARGMSKGAYSGELLNDIQQMKFSPLCDGDSCLTITPLSVSSTYTLPQSSQSPLFFTMKSIQPLGYIGDILCPLTLIANAAFLKGLVIVSH